MQHVQEDVVVVGELDQRRAHHRVVREVERMLGLLLEQALELGFPCLRLEARQVDARQPNIGGRLDELHRRLSDEVVARAQDLVTIGERLERELEHIRVDRAAKPEGSRGVVCDAAIRELAEQPEELLRVRQRNGAENVAGRDGVAANVLGALCQEALLEQCPLLGRQVLEALVQAAAHADASTSASSASSSSPPDSASKRSAIAAASSCTFECWKTTVSGRSQPHSRSTSASICTASSECPPSSKKSSRTPTRSTRRSCCQMPASSCSIGVCGSRYGSSSAGRDASGAGRAARSSFRFGVTGRTSRTTKDAGTM